MIIAGVYGGFVTIAEVSAVVLVYVILVECFVLKEIHFLKQLPGIIVESMILSGAVIVILSMALGFTAYLVDEQIHWVMHAHHAPIWQAAGRLGLPCTSADAAYGTPEMAAETLRLFAETDVRQKGIFAMAGHEDGIISFGNTAKQAAEVMSRFLELVR